MRDMMHIVRPVSPKYAAQVHGMAAPVAEAAQEQAAQLVEPHEATVSDVAKPAARSGHRVGWWVSMVVIGIVFGALAVGYLKFIDGPSVGTANNSLETARAAAAPKAPTPNMLSGLAIEFQYPGIFDVVSQVKTDNHATEQYNIGSKSDYSRTIAVSVKPLTTYDDDSSYRMRQIKKDEYRETNDKMGADPMVLMTKLDRSEQTMFWIHQSREVTVSITTNNPKDDVTEIMKMVKSTLRWRK